MTLQLDKVSVKIGRKYLIREISASFAPGRLTAIIGRNGSGKTTMLRTAAGELQPSAGTVHFCERKLQDYAPLELAQMRAVQEQKSELAFGFTCLDVVMMGRHPHPTSPPENVRLAKEALDAVRMRSFSRRNYLNLSGGEQQRIHLARLYAQLQGEKAALALLDEPTSALDLAHQQEALQLLRTLCVRGLAVAVVLHDLTLVAQYADDVVLMKDGRIEAQGPRGEVLRTDLLERVFGLPLRIENSDELGQHIWAPDPNAHAENKDGSRTTS